MHILIIPSEFFDDEYRPLAGIFQKDQVEVLSNKGHQLGVLAIKPKFTFYELVYATFKRRTGYLTNYPLLKAWVLFIKNCTLPIQSLIQNSKKSKFQLVKYNGCYSLQTKRNLHKRADWVKIGNKAFDTYVKNYGKPDVIHAHNVLFGGMLGNYLSRKYQIPMVLTEHSSAHQMSPYKEADRKMIAEELKQIRSINAVSPALGRLMEKKYKLKHKLIDWLPNVMDKVFEEMPIREDRGSVDKTITLLNVSSLIPLKCQSILIDAFTAAFKNKEGVNLELVGGGALKEQLQQQIKSLGMQKRIQLLGALDRADVLKKMNESDFLVHSSEYETFGVVLIEALAMGKPVVSTACGGPECIIHEKNGILVLPKEVEALAYGMKTMVKNMEQYDASEIKKDLIERFGQEAFYQRLMNIYKKAIYDYHH